MNIMAAIVSSNDLLKIFQKIFDKCPCDQNEKNFKIRVSGSLQGTIMFQEEKKKEKKKRERGGVKFYFFLFALKSNFKGKR